MSKDLKTGKFEIELTENENGEGYTLTISDSDGYIIEEFDDVYSSGCIGDVMEIFAEKHLVSSHMGRHYI